jgi:LacI family transcriptional regulator
MDDRKAAKAEQFIKLNTNKPFQIRDVVEATSISKRSLQLRFRRELGRSILDEIRRLRTDQVAKMLATATIPVSKIALDLGYPDPRNRKGKG